MKGKWSYIACGYCLCGSVICMVLRSVTFALLCFGLGLFNYFIAENVNGKLSD